MIIYRAVLSSAIFEPTHPLSHSLPSVPRLHCSIVPILCCQSFLSFCHIDIVSARSSLAFHFLSLGHSIGLWQRHQPTPPPTADPNMELPAQPNLRLHSRIFRGDVALSLMMLTVWQFSGPMVSTNGTCSVSDMTLQKLFICA